MVKGEQEMVRKDSLLEQKRPATEERFTSLQPTYEDSVPPETDWELEDPE